MKISKSRMNWNGIFNNDLHIKKSFKNLYSMAKEIANQVGYSFPWMASTSCRSLSKWINTSVPFQTQWHCWVFWISGTNLDMNPHSWRGKRKSHRVSRCRVCLETLASHSSQRLTTLLEWELLFLHKQKSFLRVINIASVRSSQTSLLVSYEHNKTTCSVLWGKKYRKPLYPFQISNWKGMRGRRQALRPAWAGNAGLHISS